MKDKFIAHPIHSTTPSPYCATTPSTLQPIPPSLPHSITPDTKYLGSSLSSLKRNIVPCNGYSQRLIALNIGNNFKFAKFLLILRGYSGTIKSVDGKNKSIIYITRNYSVPA